MIRRHPVWVAFVLFALVFSLFPSVDVWIAGLAWNEVEQSFIRDIAWINGLYSAFQGVLGYFLLVYGLALLLPWWLANWQIRQAARGAPSILLPAVNDSRLVRWLRRHQKDIWYMLVVLIIGAVVIEVLMKGFWGRPRPHQIIEFGGSLNFVPFLQVSDVCSRNCSFASGHAGIGFYFMALAWPMRKAIWLVPGIILGGLLAYVRIAMGGHFFTDVITSGFVIFAICWLLGHLFYQRSFN
ncbi:phosphatase PAP2 family protein [Salinibius halmophilus]|uniref:phosphatase PAP2 family protein n=1 Tax=Salinibius halmophilus TaxID=1853216 RepID=UPI000E673FC5|nr:phosphatase PAP2 family protein [Salinibius halmophilus]